MTELPPVDRRFSLLTPERVDLERESYRRAPYNIARRARELGVSAALLWYHLKGRKSGDMPRAQDRRASRHRAAPTG
jgi:hypothetical protein